MGSSQSTPTTPVKGVPEEPIVRPKQEDNIPFPIPTGHEYDAIDRIAAELPNVIDDESRQQVEDYRQACDNGKGPMVCLRWPVLVCFCWRWILVYGALTMVYPLS